MALFWWRIVNGQWSMVNPDEASLVGMPTASVGIVSKWVFEFFVPAFVLLSSSVVPARRIRQLAEEAGHSLVRSEHYSAAEIGNPTAYTKLSQFAAARLLPGKKSVIYTPVSAHGHYLFLGQGFTN